MIGIDIKMPKDCAHCPMDQDTYGGGYCLLTNTSTNAVRFVRRSDNCPFVTINDLAEEIKVTNCNHNAEVSKMVSSSCGHENGKDAIYRQDAKDRLTILVNEIESIFADIRERNVDDSVCGLCEYDCDHGIDGSAFECLGFERDDCFKLKDEYRKEWTDVSALPSAQSEPKEGE
jgi:hypothetical protein